MNQNKERKQDFNLQLKIKANMEYFHDPGKFDLKIFVVHTNVMNNLAHKV